MFSLSTVLQIIFSNLFYLNHEEKTRAYLTDLVFTRNFNYQSLFLNPSFLFFHAKRTPKKYLLNFEAEYNGYTISVDYRNKNNIFYSIFQNTIFEPFFIDKKITISKNSTILYKDGLKHPEYSAIEQDINNTMVFFVSELENCSKKHSLNNI